MLLYDGLCAMCNAAVRFVLARDRTGTIRFAPLQGELGDELRVRHPEIAGIDSIIFMRRGSASDQIHTRSDALLAVADHLSQPWRALRHLRVIPRPVRDMMYGVVARNRGRISHRYETCPLPPPHMRDRFIA